MSGNFKGKLLVVEDDKYYSRTIKGKFNSLGTEVVLAENGKQMLETLQTFSPDLVLLDLVMPVMSGFEALEKLRAGGSKIKVIALSNLGQEEEIERAKKMGVSDYVVKSNASIQEVVDMVGKYLKG